jgi:predicted permease
MRGVFSDCRYALRLLAQTPLTSALALGALAIAIGFVSSLLTLYVDLRFRPHAGYEDSGELITLGQSDGETLTGIPYGLLQLMAEEMTSIKAVAGSTQGQLLATDEGDSIAVEYVSRGFFDGLRPRLHAGRGFRPDEHWPDAERVAVVSWRYWQDTLGGGDVLGTAIVVDIQPTSFGGATELDRSDIGPPEFRIVGILEPEVSGFVDEAAIWLPWEQAARFDNLVPPEAVEPLTRRTGMRLLARLAEGASTQAVINEMQTRYSEVTGSLRLSTGRQFYAADGLVTDIAVLRESKQQLLMLLAASVLLCFVAAANVSLFLLARDPGRQRELAVRMAVGAPLGRLGRQLATEAATLVVVASALGLAIGVWFSQILRGLALLRRASWNDVALLDWRVLGGVAALLLLLTVLVSLAPVLGLRVFGIDAASRATRARATPMQRIAGTVQIAIAGSLGGAAIALGWDMASILFAHPGFETNDRYSVAVEFNRARAMLRAASPGASAGAAEMLRHREAIEAIPGVRAVTFGVPVPGQSYGLPSQIPSIDKPGEFVTIDTVYIDDRYIDVLGLRLLHGREPTDGDAGAVLVNRAFAQALWGRDDVVGERADTSNLGLGEGEPREIIGVLDDVSFGHPLARVRPIVFQVRGELTSSYQATVVSSRTPGELEQEIRRIVAGGDVEFEVSNTIPLAARRDELIAPDRVRSLLTMGAAGLVVLLAALGFYGTERYLVMAGRRECAIRAVLGAGPRAIGRLVFLRATLFVTPGIVMSALLAFATVGWLRADYVSREISPGVVTAAVVLGLVALLFAASLGPALTAMRTQPAPLLREE